MSAPIEPSDRLRYQTYLESELEAAGMYKILLDSEPNLARRDIFKQLFESEMKHADRWAKKLGIDNSDVKPIKHTIKLLYIRLICKLFGPDKIIPWIAKLEAKEVYLYTNDIEGRDLVPEERKHARILATLVHGSDGVDIVRNEPGHIFVRGGGLRAGVLGLNDGLVSNFCLVMGAAGGATTLGKPELIILTGIAGLVAGAFSMGTGEYISMRTQRDIYERQIEVERAELEQWPEEEEEELSLIYMAKGIPAKEARELAAQIIKDPAVALDTMSKEELGLDPSTLGSPWSAAMSSFVAFSGGAIVPIMPYLFGSGTSAFIFSALFSISALLVVGALLSSLSAKNIFWGALRMLIAGTLAAAITFGVGYAIGMALT